MTEAAQTKKPAPTAQEPVMRSKFSQRVYEFYGGDKFKQAPATPSQPGQAAPRQTAPASTQAPQSKVRSPFTEMMYKYQTQMQKETERMTKELQKFEQEQIKQFGQPQLGQPGLAPAGTSLEGQPSGSVEAMQGAQAPAQQPTSPPVQLPQGGEDVPGIVYPQNQALMEAFIPPALQATMAPAMLEVNPYHQFPTEVAQWLDKSPYGQLFVGPGTQRAVQMVTDMTPGLKFTQEDVRRRFKNAPSGSIEDIPLVGYIKQIAPTPQKALDIYEKLSGKKKGPLSEYFKGEARGETKTSMLSHEARLLAEWIIFPYVLKAANKSKVLGYPLETLLQDRRLFGWLSRQTARLRARFKRDPQGMAPEEEEVLRELERWVDNTGKTQKFKGAKGEVIGESEAPPKKLYTIEEKGGQLSKSIESYYLDADEAVRNMPKWTQGDIYLEPPTKRPVEPVTKRGELTKPEELLGEQIPRRRTGFGEPEPTKTILRQRGPKEQPPGAGRPAEELVTEPAPSIIKPGEVSPGGRIVTPAEAAAREFPKGKPPAHGETGIEIVEPRKKPVSVPPEKGGPAAPTKPTPPPKAKGPSEAQMKSVVKAEGGVYQRTQKLPDGSEMVEIRVPEANNTNIQIPRKDFSPKTVRENVARVIKNFKEIDTIPGFQKAVKESLDPKGNLSRGADYYKGLANKLPTEIIKPLYDWATKHESAQVRRTITEIMSEQARLRGIKLEPPTKPPEPPKPSAPKPPSRIQEEKAIDDLAKAADQIQQDLKAGKITKDKADELLKKAEETYKAKRPAAPKKEPAPEKPSDRVEARQYVRAETKEEFMESVNQALASSKGEGGMVEFDFQGTKFRVEDSPEVLEKFMADIGKTGFKATKVGKEPTKSMKATLRRPFLRERTGLEEGETYYRRLTDTTPIRTPKEYEVFTPDKGKPVHPINAGGKKGYTDGYIMEVRDKPPTVKAEIGKETIESPELGKALTSKGYRKAKANFETEEGVYIHTKDDGVVIPHEYYDYIRTKYGPAVEWEIGPKVPKGEMRSPVRFSLAGEPKGLVSPMSPDKVRSLEEVVTAYGSHTKVDITLESGGLQTFYEKMVDTVRKAGGKAPKYNKDLKSKSFPNGLVQFESQYTGSSLNIRPEDMTTQAVKQKLLTNYAETKKLGGQILEKWPEGEAFVKGPPTGPTTLEVGGLQTTYEKFMKILKGMGKNKDLPKRARSINLERQAIPEEMKQFQAEVGRLAPKTYQSWPTTQKAADEIVREYHLGRIGKATKIIEKVKRGEGLNAKEIQALRQINVNAISRLKEMTETLPPERFNESFVQYVEDIFNITSDAASEMGRGLNILKKDVSINRMANAFAKLKRSMRPRELKEFNELNFENPIEVKRFIERLGDPKLSDYFYEFWYNSILSGPPTHLVNTISNTGWGLFQVPHRAMTAGMDAVYTMLKGGQRQVYVREIAPMLAGYRTGFLKGKAGAAEMIRTGRIREFESKWARDMGHTVIGAFERSPYEPLRKMAPYISMPTRALRAMDVWANSISFDAQLQALAYRAGRQQGLAGKALKTFQREFLANPSREALQEAAKFAKTATFMDDPGKFVAGIAKLRANIPGGRIVVPFVNTIANLTMRGVEMTPGLGLVAARGKLPAEVMAKQLEGTILSGYVLWKAAEGDITGPAPKNKAEREAFYREGKLAWSIKIGDKWYSYRRMEPFNTVIASAAIAYDKIKNAKDDETATEIFSKYANGMIDNLIDSSYLQGLSDLVFNRYERREAAIRRTAASVVPFSSLWRSLLRSYEVATTGSAKLRESKDLLGAFAQVIPTSVLALGMPKVKESAAPKLDVWGKEIVIPGGVVRQFLPYKAAEVTKDPVEIEFARLNQSLKQKGEDTLFLGMPEKEINGNELTDEQYREYVKLRGKNARIRMEPFIKSPGWKNIPDTDKRRRLSSMWTSAGNTARLMMKSRYPKLGIPGKIKRMVEERANVK